MIEFIPVENYKTVFTNFQLIIALIFFFKALKFDLTDASNLKANNFLATVILIIIIFYIGLRPISFAFGDMGIYAKLFDDFKENSFIEIEGDFLFYYMMKFCTTVVPVEVFFLICAFLYIYPMYLVSKKLFKEYWAYSFLMLILSFSFWAYGTNGIRNGIATSIFLLAVVQEKKKNVYLLLFCSVNFHASMAIPIVMYVIATYYRNTKYLFYFWIFCIPLSLVLGSTLESFFLSLGMGDADKLGNYLTENDEYQEMFSSVGFRWDFLIYSGTAIFTGLYFILKRDYQDQFYKHLFNVFLLTNAIWILVIRANFSNRFAYLSWFMMGLIIIYPFLKMKFFDRQHVIVGRILLTYSLLTYLLSYLLT